MKLSKWGKKLSKPLRIKSKLIMIRSMVSELKSKTMTMNMIVKMEILKEGSMMKKRVLMLVLPKAHLKWEIWKRLKFQMPTMQQEHKQLNKRKVSMVLLCPNLSDSIWGIKLRPRRLLKENLKLLWWRRKLMRITLSSINSEVSRSLQRYWFLDTRAFLRQMLPERKW